MEITASKVEFVPDPAAFKHFTQDKNGEVGTDLMRRGRKLAFNAKRTVGKETGRLARSIDVKFIPGRNPSVMIGSDVGHALVVHEGSKPHEIAAEPGRVMRFSVGGKMIYAQEIRHPGTRPQKYLTRHLRKAVND